MSNRPNVLVLSGHDPSGGAGFQADIEAIGALGAHGAGVLTTLTRQDTRNAYAVSPTPVETFAAAMDTLFADMAFAAVKIGLAGGPEQVGALAERLGAHPSLPVVLDPVLRAGGGASLAADPTAAALREQLFPHTTLITPNAAEARMLCDGEPALDACGAQLSERTATVLITGGDEPGERITNSLYQAGERVERFEWPRLAGPFHGAGCTLSAAIAAQLAHAAPLRDAVAAGQRYTHTCLAAAFAPGQGQKIPARVSRSQ